MPGSWTRRLSASARTSLMVVGEPLRHLVRVIARDRLVRTERAGGVALIDRPLALDQPEGTRPSHTRRIRTLEPVPPAASKARVRRASLAGADMPSMRMPAPQRAARTAAATDTAALRTGTGSRRQASNAGSPSSSPSVLTSEHRDEPRELRFEPIDRIGQAHAGRFEVQRQGAGGHSRVRRDRGDEPAARRPPRQRAPWTGGEAGAAPRRPTPVRCSARTKDAICSGCAMYPAKPPWCSLVMTPSKPQSSASPACVQSSLTMSSAASSLCGYSRMETDPRSNGTHGRTAGDESVRFSAPDSSAFAGSHHAILGGANRTVSRIGRGALDRPRGTTHVVSGIERSAAAP